MKCPSCGKEIPDYAQACVYCWEEVPPNSHSHQKPETFLGKQEQNSGSKDTLNYNSPKDLSKSPSASPKETDASQQKAKKQLIQMK